LQISCSVRKDAGLDIIRLIALKQVADDVDHARMAGEHQLSTGSLQAFGDKPGETLVVADSGDEGNLACQIDRNHDPSSRNRNSEQWAVYGRKRHGSRETGGDCFLRPS